MHVATHGAIEKAILRTCVVLENVLRFLGASLEHAGGRPVPGKGISNRQSKNIYVQMLSVQAL